MTVGGATNTTTQGVDSTIGKENMELPNNPNTTVAGSISSTNTTTESGSHAQRRLLQTADKSDDQTGSAETHGNDAGTTGEATAENSEPLEDDANASFDLFKDAEDLPDEYNYDYDDYVDESMWGDEDWTEHEHEKAENYVSIDAHILSTPVSKPFCFILHICVFLSLSGFELV
jgi:hypothetical protein